jgi:hypothetical protein
MTETTGRQRVGVIEGSNLSQSSINQLRPLKRPARVLLLARGDAELRPALARAGACERWRGTCPFVT